MDEIAQWLGSASIRAAEPGQLEAVRAVAYRDTLVVMATGAGSPRSTSSPLADRRRDAQISR
jgi:hypothetical protein